MEHFLPSDTERGDEARGQKLLWVIVSGSFLLFTLNFFTLRKSGGNFPPDGFFYSS